MADSLLGLDEKVAIVTGGGGNIGAATVRMLAHAGARVVVADLDAGDAESSASAVVALGGEAIAVQADTRRVGDIDRMVQTALDAWGRLDIGVNIVGGGNTDTLILDAPDSVWDDVIELNLPMPVRRVASASRRTLPASTTVFGVCFCSLPDSAALRSAAVMSARNTIPDDVQCRGTRSPIT